MPPIGVTGPRKETLKGITLFRANRYIEPEKNSIPKRKSQNTHFLVLEGIPVAKPTAKSANT